MTDKRVLTIQDISCFGQCSLTVALPIISACGIETAVIPSAVLSTHTGGFTGFTCRDLAEDIPKIRDHWKEVGVKFDAVYTGYLGTPEMIADVISIMDDLGTEGSLNIVDPAMADGGVLYPAFDMVYVEEMKKLCAKADIILPNITEACMLTGMEYKEEYDEAYIDELLAKLSALGAETVILTGVGYKPGRTGVVVFENKEKSYYEHRRIEKGCHGTGDVYASTFVGALINGKDAFTSAKIAADYTVRCIEITKGDTEHWYGVKFEKAMPELISAIHAE
ncbi:MAG: pyridoxamine kinase [Methanocorpusculum parvum]|nr:pyridoxamine kinase [Methanocorpusculum parvum]